MKREYKERVKRALIGRPHLLPVFTHVYDIPRRIYEYDKEMFVIYNTASNQYEIHSLNHSPDTLALTIPYSELDIRAIYFLWEQDLRIHGRAIFDRIYEGEERAEKMKEKDWKNWVRDVASETKSLFAKDAWTEI